MLANISSTHVKSPQALGLQKASPELGDRPWWLSLYHRFPRTELLVLQPLSPELYKLIETELLVRRVPSHCLFLNVQPGGSYNDTMEDTSPAGKCTDEEEKRGRRTKYGAPPTGEEDADRSFISQSGKICNYIHRKYQQAKKKTSMSIHKICYNRSMSYNFRNIFCRTCVICVHTFLY